MSKVKLSLCISFIVMSLFIFGVIAPTLVSAKSTELVFIGFALTAVAVGMAVYSLVSLVRGK